MDHPEIDLPATGELLTREALIAGGFTPTQYPGKEGEHLTKRTRAEDLPYTHEHVVDESYVYGSSEAITELNPQGFVHLYIPDADYVEGPAPVGSAHGQAILRDALSARV